MLQRGLSAASVKCCFCWHNECPVSRSLERIGWKRASGAAFLVGVALVGCTGVAEPLPDIPSTLALRPTTPTTRRQNVARLTIQPLEGTTTTTIASFAEGSVSITGRVLGPDGPVSGATVVLERVVGEQSTILKLQADADGRYDAKGIKGGIVKISAFRIPDLASPESVVIFASGATEADLSLQAFNGTDIQWALGPAQPYVGRSNNLVVRVAVKRVDPDGIVRFAPLEGIGVRIVPISALQPTGPTERITDAQGLSSFQMSCTTVGTSGVSVFLATGEQTDIKPRNCSVPPTTPPPTLPPPPGDAVQDSDLDPDNQEVVEGEPVVTRRRVVRVTTTILATQTLPTETPATIPQPAPQ